MEKETEKPELLENVPEAPQEAIPVIRSPQPARRAAAQPAETLYSAAELAGAARARLGVSPDVVWTALRLAGKKKASLTEAKRLVKECLERKVRR